MNRTTKMCLNLVLILVVAMSFVVIGNLVGNATPKAYAAISLDEAGICKLTAMIFDEQGNPTGKLDKATLLECLAEMDTD